MNSEMVKTISFVELLVHDVSLVNDSSTDLESMEGGYRRDSSAAAIQQKLIEVMLCVIPLVLIIFVN
jgi:hypothetical protein